MAANMRQAPAQSSAGGLTRRYPCGTGGHAPEQGHPEKPYQEDQMANPRKIAYADLESLAGQEVGVSDWHTIDQKRVNLFADATGDHQWIHIDVERATKEMGGPIAHGFLTLSLLPMLGAEVLRVDGVTRGINYGSDKVRFTNMVPVGSKVRLRQKCLSVEAKAGGKQMKMEATVEIEGKDRPALVAESITVLYG
jgi:acyl dehydratase